MPDIQTFRPIAVNTSIGWAATGGTEPAVLSDDNLTTFVSKTLSGANALVLLCGTHTPPAGHERHRGRIRIAVGTGVSENPWVSRGQWTVDPVTSAIWSRQVTTVAVQTVNGPWSTPPGLIPAGSLDVRWRNNPSPAGPVALIYEAWVDIDSRAKPAFVADVLDGAGNSAAAGTITDTTVPRLVFDGLDLDGLPGRNWDAWVYTLAQTLAGGFTPFVTVPITSRSGVGVPPALIEVDPIPNGDYVAYMRASSTIRGAAAFPSDVETVAFEMDVATPPAPILTVTVDPPSAVVCWEPGPDNGTDWDNDQEIVIEIQRSDCFRDWFTILTAHTALTNCYVDRFVPLFDETCEDCEPEDAFNCEVNYRARYWGHVGDILMSTDWGET